jgi:hypothetical protein
MAQFCHELLLLPAVSEEGKGEGGGGGEAQLLDKQAACAPPPPPPPPPPPQPQLLDKQAACADAEWRALMYACRFMAGRSVSEPDPAGCCCTVERLPHCTGAREGTAPSPLCSWPICGQPPGTSRRLRGLFSQVIKPCSQVGVLRSCQLAVCDQKCDSAAAWHTM